MFVYKLFDRAYRDYVQKDDILRQLNIIVLSAAIGTFLFTAQGGVAFVGYASSLGAGEFVFGVIAALPVLAGLLQIYVSHLVVKTEKYKQFFLVGGVIQRVLWIVIAFIPYIFAVEQSRLWMMVVLVTLAAMGGSFVVIPHTTLMANIIPINIRGRYVTTRQRVSTAVSLLVGFGIAFLLDRTPGFLGYTIVFAVGGVAGLIDILMYSAVDFSIIPSRKEGGPSLFEGIKSCFTHPKMRNYLLFWTFWQLAINMSGAFFSKYAVDVLSLSYMQIIIFGQIVSTCLAFLVITRWGVFLDRYGSVPIIWMSTITTSVVTLVWLFATPGNILPLLAFHLIGGVFWCANEACFVNMQMSHTPSEGRPAALAVFAVFISVATAISIIIGGALLETFSPIMARLALTFMGTPFDHYKLVFCIGFVVRIVVLIIFLPKVWNEKDLTLREAFSKAYADISTSMKAEFSKLKRPRLKKK